MNNNKTVTVSVFNGIVMLFIASSTICNANQVNVQSINIRVKNDLYFPDTYWDNNVIKVIEIKSTTPP